MPQINFKFFSKYTQFYKNKYKLSSWRILMP